MRLICPNCEAEYEVDDAAIPDTGRDVQCSNCGHAWFQLPPEIELALEQEEELFGQGAATDPFPDADEEDIPAPLAAAAAASAPQQASPAAAPMPDAPKRSVDENLLAILREEAEREAAARKAEASALEVQGDLGLPPAGSAAPAAAAGGAMAGLGAAARRIAQLKGVDPDAPPPVPPKPPTRRDMLPDIEEINSSLKGGDVLPPLAEPEETDGRAAEARGFRSGFGVALLVAVIGLAVYVSAPRIAAMVPAAEGAMTAYVGAVDAGRLWLDGAMRSATQSLREMAGQSEGG